MKEFIGTREGGRGGEWSKGDGVERRGGDGGRGRKGRDKEKVRRGRSRWMGIYKRRKEGGREGRGREGKSGGGKEAKGEKRGICKRRGGGE